MKESAAPTKVRINKVQDRMIFLAPSVKLGQENEANLRDFDIGDILGQGAFGKVFKVVHKVSKRVFALKIIDKKRIRKNSMEAQMQNEIKIMYSLNHPNVVRLFNHFEDDESIYLVVEFAEEGQLMNKLKKVRKFPEAVAAGYLRDLVSALGYIHNRTPPILHRDIKPENLLMTADGKLKLGDFGWSNYGTEEERMTYCGTPEYLAPEMIQQRGHTEKLDIWCTGVLMFELLTGKTPFLPQTQAKDQRELQYNLQKRILEGKIVFPPDYSPLAKDLTQKLLKVEPKDRISIADIKNHPWFKQCSVFFDDDKTKPGSLKSTPENSTVETIKDKEVPPQSPTTTVQNPALTPSKRNINTPQAPPPQTPKSVFVQKKQLAFEIEGKRIEESEIIQPEKDISDNEASSFFQRESIISSGLVPSKVETVRVEQAKMPRKETSIQDSRKSAGGFNELINHLNEQLIKKDAELKRVNELNKTLDADNKSLRREVQGLKLGSSGSADLSSTMESKKYKLIQDQRDKHQALVEEQCKKINCLEETIDTLQNRVRAE
jgi:serine/threonine protein kinase